MRKVEIFPARRAIERLRAGLFDPVAVDRLTIENEAVTKKFLEGLRALEKGRSGYLCICGSYGQGKSHNLTYLQRRALSEGYATSLIQLDAREIPFHQFSVIYQSLMRHLSLPREDSLIAKWKQSSVPSEVLDGMPQRFRLILQGIIAKESTGTRRKSSKKNGLKSKDFDHWLEKAFLGHDLPASQLQQILNIRGLRKDRDEPLTCRGNAPYIQMVQCLGKFFHAMGYKGLVLFFDEAESIAQGHLSARVKSYQILSQFFEHIGFVYPIFAFTESFFDKVQTEEYGGEAPLFPQNYAEAWKDLEIIRLEDSSLNRWGALQDRLIELYAEAYQVDLSEKKVKIKHQMNHLLEKLKMQETRFKLKALIHQLDIISTAS